VKRVLLLTGQPGSGKTALIKEALGRTKVKGGGFYTEEIRTAGIRQGFRIITLDGQEAILAHVDISSPHRVSKYKVDTGPLDRVVVSALRQALTESDLVVMTQALNSGKKVLGTIMLNRHPFADEIKRHPQAEVLLVTRDNRTDVMKKVTDWIGSH
jgi:nucleoside-triphosphatase THEP1